MYSRLYIITTDMSTKNSDLQYANNSTASDAVGIRNTKCYLYSSVAARHIFISLSLQNEIYTTSSCVLGGDMCVQCLWSVRHLAETCLCDSVQN